MTEIATIDWFGRWGTSVFRHLFSLKTLLYFFLHATFALVWLNIAFIAVHSGESCGRWASGCQMTYCVYIVR